MTLTDFILTNDRESERLARAIPPLGTRCQWRLLREATQVAASPMGDVPICDRCKARVGALS